MIEWFLTPLSGAATHQIADAVAWHGRLMVFAWGVCAPAGILAARYWKIAPKQQFPATLDSKAWWHSHRFFQSACAVLTLGAIALIYKTAPLAVISPLRLSQKAHQILGYGIGGAVVLQIVHALFRGTKGGPTDITMRGDHYDMTPHRRRFERVHKSLGWLSLAAAWITVALGMVLADAPRWMPASLVLWWGVLAFLAIRWQRAGRCVDTYQAIWGLDTMHPGNAPNAPPPIGIGVKKNRIS